MVAVPLLPDNPAKAVPTAKGIVERGCPSRMFFPRLYVLAERDDVGGLACRDGGVAGASVMGAICGDHDEALAVCDLVQHVGLAQAA